MKTSFLLAFFLCLFTSLVSAENLIKRDPDVQHKRILKGGKSSKAPKSTKAPKSGKSTKSPKGASTKAPKASTKSPKGKETKAPGDAPSSGFSMHSSSLGSLVVGTVIAGLVWFGL